MGGGGSNEVKETSLQRAQADIADEQWSTYQNDLKQYEDLFMDKVDDLNNESEYDRLFSLVCDQIPNPNPKEVKDWKYISYQELKKDIQDNPQNYTEWFKIIFSKISNK
jgi:isopentenyldiphosphate isomerase